MPACFSLCLCIFRSQWLIQMLQTSRLPKGSQGAGAWKRRMWPASTPRVGAVTYSLDAVLLKNKNTQELRTKKSTYSLKCRCCWYHRFLLCFSVLQRVSILTCVASWAQRLRVASVKSPGSSSRKRGGENSWTWRYLHFKLVFRSVKWRSWFHRRIGWHRWSRPERWTSAGSVGPT